jgi:acyl dehydratase
MSQLYYEDVKVDDEMEPLERTPTTDQAIDVFGRDNPTNPAFSDIEAGKRLGVGGALVPGLLKLSWLTQYVGD